MQTRLVIGAGLLMAAFAVIIAATYFQNNEAYYTVDELVSNAALYQVADGGAGQVGMAQVAEAADSSPAGSRRMQVRGDIDKGSVQRGADGLELRFTITGKDHQLPVVYRDMVPDTFDLASQVTVGGRLGPNGTFEADQLFVQCPSKYEAEAPGAELAAPAAPADNG